MAVMEGLPTDVSDEVAERCIGNKSPLHRWIQLGLEPEIDLSRVDFDAVKAAMRPKLLQPGNTIVIPPMPAYVVKNFFSDLKANGVKVGWKWNGLDEILLAAGEEPAITEATTLRSHLLLANSVDAPILTELSDLARTSFGLMSEIVKKQGNGEPGALLTNGSANIFYPASAPDWAVDCSRDSGYGWSFNAYPVSSTDPWGEGYRVFSLDSLES